VTVHAERARLRWGARSTAIDLAFALILHAVIAGRGGTLAIGANEALAVTRLLAVLVVVARAARFTATILVGLVGLFGGADAVIGAYKVLAVLTFAIIVDLTSLVDVTRQAGPTAVNGGLVLVLDLVRAGRVRAATALAVRAQAVAVRRARRVLRATVALARSATVDVGFFRILVAVGAQVDDARTAGTGATGGAGVTTALIVDAFAATSPAAIRVVLGRQRVEIGHASTRQGKSQNAGND